MVWRGPRAVWLDVLGADGGTACTWLSPFRGHCRDRCSAVERSDRVLVALASSTFCVLGRHEFPEQRVSQRFPVSACGGPLCGTFLLQTWFDLELGNVISSLRRNHFFLIDVESLPVC